MAEVTSAVIATSLVLISVFVPVSFFPGTTGILYKQFSLTIAFSIAISAFNALTLSPALAAIFLRGEKDKRGLLGLIDRRIIRAAFATAKRSARFCACATWCCCSFSAAWRERFIFTTTCRPPLCRRKIRTI